MGLQVEVVKGLVVVGLFILTFVFSNLPLKFYTLVHDHSPGAAIAHRRGKRVVSFLSCFAAGVFLATCLLHLFPDVEKELSSVLDRMNIFSTFPVSEFVMTFGFFLILVIEQVVLTMKEKHDEHEHNEHKPLLSNGSSRQSYTNTPDDEILDENVEDSVGEPFPTMTSSGEHHDHSIHADQSSHSTVRSFILLLALSLHAVFEGLAVGLQRTSADVIQIFSALMLHKCILGFSLGLNLVQSKLSRGATIRANLVFSIMSPLGVAVGIAVDDVTDSMAASLVSGILQGIACGTFLYVTFFEILPHEFNSKSDRMLKVLFLILGYSALVAILFLNPDDDNVPRCGGESRPVGGGGGGH